MKPVGMSENLRGSLDTDQTTAEKLSVAGARFQPGSTPWHVASEAMKLFTELAEHYELTVEEFLAASSVLAGGCAATLVAVAKEEGAVPVREDTDGEEYADFVEAFMDLTVYHAVAGMVRTGTIPMAVSWTPVRLGEAEYDPNVCTLETQIAREDDGSTIYASIQNPGSNGRDWDWSVSFDARTPPDFPVEAQVRGGADTRQQAIAAAEEVIKLVAIVPPGGIDADYARQLGEAAASQPVPADHSTL